MSTGINKIHRTNLWKENLLRFMQYEDITFKKCLSCIRIFSVCMPWSHTLSSALAAAQMWEAGCWAGRTQVGILLLPSLSLEGERGLSGPTTSGNLKSQHMNYTLFYHEPSLLAYWSDRTETRLAKKGVQKRFLLWAWNYVWFQIAKYRKDTNILGQVQWRPPKRLKELRHLIWEKRMRETGF